MGIYRFTCTRALEIIETALVIAVPPWLPQCAVGARSARARKRWVKVDFPLLHCVLALVTSFCGTSGMMKLFHGMLFGP